MYLEIEFEEQDNSFDLEFEQVTEISDGGFDRGYAEGYENGKGDGLNEGYANGETEGYGKGYEQGNTDGYTTGKTEGQEIGFADALAKRTELVVTENGEYIPEEGSTGFKSVGVNVQAKSVMDLYIEGTAREVGGIANKVRAYAFKNDTRVTSATFPNATGVGEQAFYGCTALVNASFPIATSMGNYAFRDCENLTTVNFPNAIKVSNYGFYGCDNLTGVNFPNATEIVASALECCYRLTSADFSKATKVGGYAFRECWTLKSVVFRSETVCNLSATTAFMGCYHILGTVNSTYNPNGDKDGYFYVPRALVDSYKAATNWSTYSTQFRALEDYTVDGTTTGALDPNKI